MNSVPTMGPVTTEQYNISNSEATAWLACELMWVFAHGMELAPKNVSVPLKRGSLGHLYFQYYVEERLRLDAADWNESAHNKAMQFANRAFMETLTEDPTAVDLVGETQFLISRYMAHHRGWPHWKLLGTEQRVDLSLTETVNMPIRYDLYVYDIRTKKFMIVDHKFTYDFWSTTDHDVNGQMPKYIAVMKANGHQVDMGMLNEIRTRPLGKEKANDPKYLWRETPYYPTKARTRTMLRQHVAASMRIMDFKSKNPGESQIAAAVPAFNKHGPCKYCNFATLCNSVTEGKTDLSVDIRTDYTANTYGYNGMPAGELI